MYGVGFNSSPSQDRQDCNLEVGNEIKIHLTKTKQARESLILLVKSFILLTVQISGD